MRQSIWTPLGRQIRQALRSEEKAFTIANAASIEKLTSGSIAALVSMGVLAAQHTAVAGAAGTVSTGLMAHSTGVAAKGIGFAAKTAGATLFTPTVAIATTVAASLTIGIAAHVAQPASAPPMEPASIIQQIEGQVEGEIMFSGSTTAFAHVNPRQATAWAQNEYGALEPSMWWITKAADEDVLYSGDKETLAQIFAGMIEGKRAGQYVLHYLMVDAEGYSFELSRRFIIDTESLD